jgi:hypothetical protein
LLNFFGENILKIITSVPALIIPTRVTVIPEHEVCTWFWSVLHTRKWCFVPRHEVFFTRF